MTLAIQNIAVVAMCFDNSHLRMAALSTVVVTMNSLACTVMSSKYQEAEAMWA